MSDKRVLIITYYWPPSGGSGVQRWLKFVKFLPFYGWSPYVFTPENPSFDIVDESLVKDIPVEAEVIKLPIWEPYRLFVKISSIFSKGRKGELSQNMESGKSLFQRLTLWIRGNLFIPDPRIFWVRPSVNFLHDFLQECNITTIITTGPPHSMHLIGLRLKRKNPALHWIADFRDPWTEWGLWEKLGLGKWAMSRHKKLENKVLTSADRVISVTPFYIERFEALSCRSVELLTNGYDEEDFNSITYTKFEKFIIRHIGIVNEQRDPIPFMKALLFLLQEDSEFVNRISVEFVGEVYQPFKEYIKSNPALQSLVVFTGNVTHNKVMEYYGSTSVLLLILTGYRDPHGFFPGKLFEYIATGVPIMGIGPVESDASTVLREAGTGAMIEASDTQGIAEALKRLYTEWSNSVHPVVKKSLVKKYSRKVLTEKLVTFLK